VVIKPDSQWTHVLAAAAQAFNRRATALRNAANQEVSTNDDAIHALADIMHIRGLVAKDSLNGGCMLDSYERALSKLVEVERKWPRWALKS
jgi:hypothetical protein